MPPRQPRIKMATCRAVRLACLIIVILAADYALYPRLARPSAPSADKGTNALWLRHTWYFGEYTDADMEALAHRLTHNGIRDAWFHVRFIRRDGSLRYRYRDQARRLVKDLRRRAPGVRALAWVYAGNGRAPGEVDLSRPDVRRRMVEEAVWLVEECGFDGVQWDYEICEDGHPGFLALIRETRAALPARKVLSCATPMWVPLPFRSHGWSEGYYSEVAKSCDQIAVMGYDSGLYLPRLYAWLVRQQAARVTGAVARGNPRAEVLIGVPTYGPGGPSHHPHAENLRVALIGVRDGMADPRARPEVFAGVAPFADYTTQGDEWTTLHALWLRDRRKAGRRISNTRRPARVRLVTGQAYPGRAASGRP